jgi:hypothetical protein
MGELHFVLLLPTITHILNKGMARLLSELTHFIPVNNIPEKWPPVIVDRPPLAVSVYERTPRRPV